MQEKSSKPAGSNKYYCEPPYYYTTAANELLQLGFETDAKNFLLNPQGTLG
jgi:hypothetical protein